jgi:ADP-heptose:LPS heptosyltransferase
LDVIRRANGLLNRILWRIGCALPKREGARPVLLLRPDLIGDFLLFTPALAPLRDWSAGRRIVLVVQTPVAALVEGCPYVDDVIPLDDRQFRRSPFYRIALLWRIWRVGASTVLYPCYSRTAVGDMLVAWSAAAVRAGWDSDVHHLSPGEKVRGDRHYTCLVPGRLPPEQHEISRNLHFLNRLGIVGDSRRTQVWGDGAPAVLAAPAGKRIALLPGASFPIKKWGAARFNELMAMVVGRAGGRDLEFVLCGQKGDADGISLAVQAGATVVDLTGRTSLRELGRLFSSCTAVVGNDTGTMHLAIAVGVPTVCIIGGGHYGRFMPYGDPARNVFLHEPLPCFQCGWNCVRSEPECITRVPVQRVAEACVQWI